MSVHHRILRNKQRGSGTSGIGLFGERRDTLLGHGDLVALPGGIAILERRDSITAVGALPRVATLAKTVNSDTLVAGGKIVSAGSLAKTELHDSLSGVGASVPPVTWGTAYLGGTTSLDGSKLTATSSGGGIRAVATKGWASGKHKFELTFNVDTFYIENFGVTVVPPALSTNGVGDSVSTSPSWGYRVRAGGSPYHAAQHNSAQNTSYGANPTAGTFVFGVYVDSDAGTIEFEVNGTKYGTAYSDLAGWTVYPVFAESASSFIQVTLNAGATAFTFPPPAGWKSWDESQSF